MTKKQFLGLLLVAVMAISPVLYAEEKTDNLKDMEDRLKRVEQNQKQILEKLDDIKANLENLRVWVRRN